MVRQHRADLLLLQETKISRDVETVIFYVWGARNCGWDWVPSEGTSGGLISIWNEDKLLGISAIKSPRVLAIKFKNSLMTFSGLQQMFMVRTWKGRGVLFGPNCPIF